MQICNNICMNVNVALQKIHQAMAAKGLRQIDLSRDTGIPQPTLSRALNMPSRLTKTHRAICKFLRIKLDDAPDLDAKSQLVRALTGTWDGTEAHAKALLSLLQAASKLAVAGTRELRYRPDADWQQAHASEGHRSPRGSGGTRANQSRSAR